MKELKSLINNQEIENRIFTIRGMQVMIDRDLAELYEVPLKAMNQAVKRNNERFPNAFRIQLTSNEKTELVTNCDRFDSLKHSTTLPYAFTEQGVAMLSAILRSKTAVKVSIQIMQAFVQMRKTISDNAAIFYRIDRIEQKQLETDARFERIFQALENKETIPERGIFYNGQVFDSYAFMATLIRKAQKSIILVDNYLDDTVLTLFAKRNKGVSLTLYTKTITKQLTLDVEKFNLQYEPLKLIEMKDAHDRFLVLDEKDLYHIGASLKDLGKKWFAFSKMDTEVYTLLAKLTALK